MKLLVHPTDPAATGLCSGQNRATALTLEPWRVTGQVRLTPSITRGRWLATPKGLAECARLSGAATTECRNWGFLPAETQAGQRISTTRGRLWAALPALWARRRLFGRNKPVLSI